MPGRPDPTALGFEIGCREGLERARKAGLPASEAWSAAGLLLARRGQAIAYPFADALLAVYRRPKDAPPAGRADRGAPPTKSGATGAPASYTRLLAALDEQPGLTAVLEALVLCGVSAAERQPEAVRLHADAARREGAADAAILHAVLAVVPVAGTCAYEASRVALSVE